MRVNDAAREVGSWGIARIRAIVPGAVLLDYGYGSRREWFPIERVEWLHHVDRWADDCFLPRPEGNTVIHVTAIITIVAEDDEQADEVYAALHAINRTYPATPIIGIVETERKSR